MYANALNEIYPKSGSLISSERYQPETWFFVGFYTDFVYVWYGEHTIHIHEPAWYNNSSLDETLPGSEIDVITIDGNKTPTLKQVQKSISRREQNIKDEFN